MRKFYISPEAEVVEFDAKDVITTSGGLTAGTGSDLLDNDDNWLDEWD